MSETRDPREASPGDFIEAAEWNRMRRLARRRVTGVNVLETLDGFHIRNPARLRGRTVVLVRDPVADDTVLWVRHVKYAKESEPAAGAYTWNGETFSAYPEFGFEIVRYGQFYWRPPEHQAGLPAGDVWDPPPDIDTKFLSVRFRGGVWIADHPPDLGIKFGVVTEVDGDLASVIGVREVAPVADTLDEFEFIGQPEPVRCWPNFRSRHYHAFKFQGSTVTIEAQILPIYQIGSSWFAMPVVRSPSELLQDGVRFTDCTPVPEG